MKTILIILIAAAAGALINNVIVAKKESEKKSLDIVSSNNEKEAVWEIQKNFYLALNDMFNGDASKMSEVWSHADDTIYMGPDNVLLKGWELISANWTKQAEKKMGGKVSVQDEHSVITQDMAVIHNYEVGENTDANGQVVRVSIRATNVYRKENGQWKMVGHHTDLLPFLADK